MRPFSTTNRNLFLSRFTSHSSPLNCGTAPFLTCTFSLLIYRIYHTRMALPPQHGDPFQVCPFLNPCGILVVKTCFIAPLTPYCSADIVASDPSRPFDKWKPERSPKLVSHTLSRHPINCQRQRHTGINVTYHSIRAVPDTPIQSPYSGARFGLYDLHCLRPLSRA